MSDRTYPSRPWSAVGVVVWKGDHVLLIQRGKEPRRGEWSIPGGSHDLGETVREAAVREVMEETGVTIRLGPIVDVIDTIRRDSAGRILIHFTLTDFAATWVAGDAVAGDDAMNAEFVPFEDALRRLNWSETARVIRESRRLLGLD
ncbi:MAG: NUDIX hydrolase [Alphaproteobacteria bacterium]|nr:NUDIX hydrolase [Alphaproteobacteria bacterium]MCB9930542.1 NUDIX hydrolase [Alphaproteobacteria bacterium]